MARSISDWETIPSARVSTSLNLEEFDRKKIYASKRKPEDMQKMKERGWDVEDDSIYENFPEKNLNYAHNNSLKIVEWDRKVYQLINALEAKGLFSE